MPSRTAMYVRVIALLIVILLGASLFTYYSISRAKEEGVNATPTSTLIIPTPAQALFYDTFLDNRNDWTLSNHAGFIREIMHNMLVLTDTNPHTTLVESLPSEKLYDDFTLTVTFAIQQGDQGDAVGIYVRGDSNLDHDYRIDISPNSTIDVAREYLDNHDLPQVAMLAGPEQIAALHTIGQLNTLTVRLQGPTMRITLNNALVTTINDSNYTSGQVALFVRHGATSPAVTMAVGEIELDAVG